MVKLILYALPFLAMFAPNMWVHYVCRKNDEHFSDMPFTAHEFGKKIIDEQELKDVSIESIKEEDHYDPNENFWDCLCWEALARAHSVLCDKENAD